MWTLAEKRDKVSARRALPSSLPLTHNKIMETAKTPARTIKLMTISTDRLGQTPDARWSLYLHYLSCRAGVGAPPGSRFYPYMSEKKNLERSPKPTYEFF